MARGSHWPMSLGIAYAAAAGGALVLALAPHGDGTGGIWSVILVLPWSMVAVLLFDAINPRLVDQFGVAAAGAGGLVNAYLVYVIAKKSQKRE